MKPAPTPSHMSAVSVSIRIAVLLPVEKVRDGTAEAEYPEPVGVVTFAGRDVAAATDEDATAADEELLLTAVGVYEGMYCCELVFTIKKTINSRETYHVGRGLRSRKY